MVSLVRDDLEDAMELARDLREEKQSEVYVHIATVVGTAEQVYKAVRPIVDTQVDLTVVIEDEQVYIKAFKEQEKNES